MICSAKCPIPNAVSTPRPSNSVKVFAAALVMQGVGHERGKYGYMERQASIV